MRIIECSGNSRQIGRITGEAIREEIRLYVDIVKGFIRMTQEDWGKWMPVFLDKMETHMPDVLEEIKGMAEGANLPEEDLLRINMLPAEERLYSNELEFGCTNISFSNGPDGPVLGKNNDMPEGNKMPVCIRKIKPDKGIPLVIFTFCGVVAAIDGMNAEGVALGHSSAGSIFQQSNYHLPVRLWAYKAHSSSRNTAEFVRNMMALPLRGKGYNILCVDKDGAMCCLEAASPIIQVRRPSNPNAMNCANVYQSPGLKDADRRSEKGKLDSIARMEFLDAAFAKGEKFDITLIKSLLTYHGEHGICRHGECEAFHTSYSYIGLPGQSRILYATGNPCGSEYKEMVM